MWSKNHPYTPFPACETCKQEIFRYSFIGMLCRILWWLCKWPKGPGFHWYLDNHSAYYFGIIVLHLEL